MTTVFVVTSDARENAQRVLSVRYSEQDAYEDAKQYILRENNDLECSVDQLVQKNKNKPAKAFYKQFSNAWVTSGDITKIEVT